MRSLLLCWLAVLTSLSGFSQALRSTVYSFNQSQVVNQSGYELRTLLEGTTRDYSHLIIQAITLPANQPGQPTQQLDEEAILIVKAGELALTIGEKRKILGSGSVVFIMPGDEFRVDNKITQPLTYYLMRYTSNEMPDLDLYRLMGSSFWVNWQEMVSKPESGSRRIIPGSTIMSRRISLQATTPGPDVASHEPDTHRAAELLFVLDSQVQMHIEGSLKSAEVGDVIFVESDVSHRIQTSSQKSSTYLSLQF